VNPLIVIVPLLIVLSAVLVFFLVPLDPGLRTLILISDLVAAGIVGVVLWRRYRG